MTRNYEAGAKVAEWYRRCDWKNPADYPDPKTASLDRWAWEFLRRNASFIRDMDGLAELAKAHPWRQRKGHALGRHPLETRRDEINERWRIKLWFLHQWIHEAPGDYDAPCRFVTGLADNVWGTYKLPNVPDKQFHIVEHDDGHFLYRVNLHWPIAPQVAAIKRHALANQACWKQNNRPEPVTNKRMHIRKFSSYLRAFDGVSAGATIAEIANRFSEEKIRLDEGKDYEKAVSNAYGAALRFIEKEEYVFIPMTT